MSTGKRWVIILLSLIALALIGWNLADNSPDGAPTTQDPNTPNYQSQHTLTVVYDPSGKLSYKLVAQDVQHYSEQGVTGLPGRC